MTVKRMWLNGNTANEFTPQGPFVSIILGAICFWIGYGCFTCGRDHVHHRIDGTYHSKIHSQTR